MSSSAVALPGIFKSLQPTLEHYGYFAVGGFLFLEDFGLPFPGETILIAAAVFAGAGRLNAIAVGVVALCAAVLGDNLGFVIGRFVGREAIVRWGRYILLTDERLDKAERFFNRNGGKIIVVARFIEGLRQANGIIAGMSEMSWLRFLPFNVLGAMLWVGVWLTIGEVAGTHLQTIYSGITRGSLYALIALAVLLLALLARFFSRRRHAKRAQHAP